MIRHVRIGRNLMPLTSFYTALTGLNSNSLAINIIGDNLANMNTIGYKAGKASFSELLAGLSGTSSNGNPIVFGLGSTFNGITHATNQGTVSYTGKSTDAAINGNGFFVVSTDGGMGFTRSGKFEFNKAGGLVSSDGYQLMGYMSVNGEIDASSAPAPIEIRKGQMLPAKATTEITLSGNLDCTSTTGSTSIQVYDSLGVAHIVTINFTGSGNDWQWSATIPAVDTGGTSTDPAVEIGSGDLGFDSTGNLTSPADNPTLSITGLASGGADMTVALGLWDSGGNPIITNFSNGSSTFTPAQNGSYASSLKEINIDSSGIIVGVSEGGNTIPLAQLAIADFPNIEGLQKYKGSTFVSFPSSGDPSIGAAGMGGRGSVVGASLEQSNVDMAQEFVNLIAAQRAYQANSKIITATDELYQDSLNMKR
jgi:flagellar hook protein FlgE